MPFLHPNPGRGFGPPGTGDLSYKPPDAILGEPLCPSAGRLRTQLVATYMLVNKLQLTQGGPYYRNISSYSTPLNTVTFRWSGRLLTSFDHGSN